MAAKHTHATTEELLEAVFSMRSVPRLYKEKRLRWGLDTKTYWLTGRQSQRDFDFDFDYDIGQGGQYGVTRVEAGSNTSTVTLRVVGGDKKGNLKSETVKYGRNSQGNWTRERMRWKGPGKLTKDRHVLSSERAPQGNKTVTVRQK
jgi:hypothetical protein